MPWDRNGRQISYLDLFRDNEEKHAAILEERLATYQAGDWKVFEKMEDERRLKAIYDRRARQQAAEDESNQRELIKLQQEKLRLEIARLKKPGTPKKAKTVKKPKKSR